MLRAYLLIFSCLFLFLGSQAQAADSATTSHATSAPPPKDLEAIFVMADQGDAASQNYLGFLYATGQTVPKDEKAAFTWFQKASNQGHAEATGNLAMMYEKGLGVAKNLHMALNLHRQAAMAGYAISMKRMASLYESGFPGEERDPVKAEMWKHRYNEAVKATGASDSAARKTTEKPAAPTQTVKPAAPSAPPPPAATVATPAATQAKPATPSPSANTAPAGKPYFFQIGGKATSRETLEVTQKIVEKNLLPQNKRIELVNPDGKSYRINIGPFSDAHEAAPYKARIMAFLNAAPPSKPVQTQPPTPSPVAPTPLPPISTTQAATSAEPPQAVPPTATVPPTAQVKPLTHAQADKPAAPKSTATPPVLSVPSPAKSEEKHHYVEVSGKATASEATELLQKIVQKGMLPKNMHVELISPETDTYRIRIGPFADANDAAPEIAKISASIKNGGVPAEMELVPVTSAHKQAAPPKQENSPPQPAASVPVQKLASAPIASEAMPKPTDGAVGTGKKDSTPNLQKPALRGHYYFIQPNTQSTFADALLFAKSLLMKELVQETRRVRIENLDGLGFRVAIGPFSDASEANIQSQKIRRQTTQALSLVAFERHASTSGESEHQLFIQLNTQGTLDHALTLTQVLVEKGLLAPKMFAEIVNFGSGNFRVRYGPFKGINEADQNIQALKSQKLAPVMVNLERLAPVDGK